MGLKLITGPTEEPVSLAEAKAQLREKTTDNDTEITSLIPRARQYVEDFTHRALITQTWELALDAFPAWAICVPKAPLASVTSIQYVDVDGNTQMLASSDYVVDTKSEPGRITPAYGKSWPATLDGVNAVTITFTAGYGNAAAVPKPIVEAIELQVEILHDRPDEAYMAVIERARDALLNHYRVWTF